MTNTRSAPFASIAALIGLFALLGALGALAPLSAVAMDDAGTGSGDCLPDSSLPDGSGRTPGGEFCSTDDSGGGSGGESTGGAVGDTSGGTVGEEEIHVSGTAPILPCINPRLCVPSETGGRGRSLPFSDRGSDPREPKRGGPQPQVDPAKVKECRAIGRRIQELADKKTAAARAESRRLEKRWSRERCGPALKSVESIPVS